MNYKNNAKIELNANRKNESSITKGTNINKISPMSKLNW